MSLKYEPASEPLHISVKKLFSLRFVSRLIYFVYHSTLGLRVIKKKNLSEKVDGHAGLVREDLRLLLHLFFITLKYRVE